MKPLVVVGDALLDRDLQGRAQRLAPDAPVPVVDDITGVARPGGAGLAAALAAGSGREVTLVTAIADDEAGRELSRLLADRDVKVVNVGLDGATTEKVRVLSEGRPLLRMDRGGGAVGAVTDDVPATLAAASAVLVSDYGRGMTAHPSVREALAGVARGTPVVWDPHPRGTQPVPGVRVATPNASEASALTPDVDGDSIAAVTERARTLVQRWRAAGVAVTLGARGALLVGGDGTPLMAPAPAVSHGDPCGAGDRFAARAAEALADGAVLSEAVVEAVEAAAAFVAAGGARSVTAAADVDLDPWGGDDPDPAGLIRRVQRAGGTAVATGGCFDLLHAGHVQLLRRARALGDCLVVCINSDESVRRIKGPDRPVVTQADRVAVLTGLECVDAVVVFDEDTPEAVLERLRPDVWAKGGDYAVADLPEAQVLRRWGGQAVVLPYLPGRSTTRLIQELSRNAR